MDTNAKSSLRQSLEAEGVKYPIGWDDMGSSEKDLWEERQERSIRRRQARVEAATQRSNSQN